MRVGNLAIRSSLGHLFRFSVPAMSRTTAYLQLQYSTKSGSYERASLTSDDPQHPIATSLKFIRHFDEVDLILRFLSISTTRSKCGDFVPPICKSGKMRALPATRHISTIEAT